MISRPSPRRRTILNAIAAVGLISATGLAWGYFILEFGWAGALLGWWPAAVMGGGGILAVLQLSEIARGPSGYSHVRYEAGETRLTCLPRSPNIEVE